MKPVSQNCGIWTIATFVTLFCTLECNSQSLNPSSVTPSRQLDSLLQDYAFQAFDHHPHTGKVYDAVVPANFSGIKISVLRLRSGSLRLRGDVSYKEFDVPTGVIVQPYVRRLALVYHNLGNWSAVYYPLSGFAYLTPVIGLLAYNAENLTATGLNELDVVASEKPILMKFADVKTAPSGLTAQCVWFDLDGLPEFRVLESDGGCSTYRQGHFAIVVNITGLPPSPAPSTGPGSFPGGKKSHKSRVWKIVGGAVGGFVGLVLLALLGGWLCRYRQNKKVAEMEWRAEVGESLHMARVGMTQAPVASGTRTQPVLENEYVA